jgi:predicted glutamine amidotransferase
LFLVAVTQVRRGATLPEALVETAAEAAKLCSQAGCTASLNLVLADEHQVVALRTASGVRANSLYGLEKGTAWPQGCLIASEALDGDPGWQSVAEDHWVRISADGLETRTSAG